MWNDIKTAANEQPNTQLRHKYANVLEVCTDKYIGEDSAKYLLQILRSIDKPNEKFDDELYFNQIRIILESMFRAANKLGLLHDLCVKGRVNLAESSLFMSGEATKHLGIACQRAHFTKLISDSVKSILFITGAASHTSDPDIKNNINLQEYRKMLSTPYLLYSLTFQLMDILIWYKQYADANSNYSTNLMHWKTLTLEPNSGSWIKGKIIKLADNGFGTFQPYVGGSSISVIPKMVLDFKLLEGQEIEITTKSDLNGTKTFIKDIRIL